LDGSDAYVVHRGRLKKFDTARAAVAWEARVTNWYGGPGFSNPVIADGVLYVTTDNRLEARSINTGAVQWYWSAPNATTGQLLIVGNHAFVGTAVETYAIDLSTRKTVWSYPAAGVLAVSQNGILYIAPPGSLVAINLH
jgi:outer membrane protein assembly factor BamB